MNRATSTSFAPPFTRPAPNRDTTTMAYRHATARGLIDVTDRVAAELGIGVAELAEAVGDLVESRLLRPEHADGTVRFVPVDPDTAAVALVSGVEREIYQRRELIDRLREQIDLVRHGAGAATPPVTGSVQQLTGSLEVRGFLKHASDRCRDELLVVHPGANVVDELTALGVQLLPMVSRGVSARLVCQHRNRADLVTRMRLKRLADAGVAVGTVSHVPRAVAVFDRSFAVLFGSDDGEMTAARVHEAGVVRFLLDLLDHEWDSATPLGDAEAGYGHVADDLQQAIAALMAKGYTDEVVARKLGMSVRTCRRHIAALMRDLDAISRFQAGVEAARRSVIGAH